MVIPVTSIPVNSMIPTELLSVAQMYEADKTTIAFGVTGEALMEAAGASVVSAILARWPVEQQAEQRAVILCGPGNNGGDGFVIARRLAEAGLKVKLALLGDRDQLTGDAAIMAGMWPGDVEDLSVAVVEGAELVVGPPATPVAYLRRDLEELFGQRHWEPSWRWGISIRRPDPRCR